MVLQVHRIGLCGRPLLQIQSHIAVKQGNSHRQPDIIFLIAEIKIFICLPACLTTFAWLEVEQSSNEQTHLLFHHFLLLGSLLQF